MFSTYKKESLVDKRQGFLSRTPRCQRRARKKGTAKRIPERTGDAESEPRKRTRPRRSERKETPAQRRLKRKSV